MSALPSDQPVQSWDLRQGDAITPELTAMRLLGGGSAYEAYLAFDEVTYSPVVVKVVRPHQVDDEETLDGLERETRALEIANHPVVVRGLRCEPDGQRPHLVLEHVEGPRLSRLIRKYGRLSEQQYVPLAIDIASALHFFGQVDVCHLDIKPSNVIMGSPGRLIDFSVARSSASAERINGLIGTDDYMAPEQADPGGSFGVPGFASDVWGLGATLFHAISGRLPFADGDPLAEEAAQRHPQLAYAASPLPDSSPSEVQMILAAMLDPDAASRPMPREVIAAFEPVLGALPAPKTLSFKVR